MEQILKKIYKSRIFGLISILFFIAVCMGIGAFAAYVKHVFQSDGAGGYIF